MLARNLAAVMSTEYGVEVARRMLESTHWDATVAEVDDDATEDGW